MKLSEALVQIAAKEIGVTEVNGTNCDYCVYIHKTKDTNTTFYVGRAKRDPRKKQFVRPYTISHRNKFWNAIAQKHGFKVEIVSYFNSLAEANLEERRLISLYGKRVMGGLLCNLADGGEGNSGCQRTDEWKENQRKSAIGRKLSLEHRAKLSDAHRGRKLSESHKKAIGAASKLHKNFRLSDPDILKKAQAARKLVKTKPRSREHQDKINAANRGRKRSLEARIKMSFSAKNKKSCSPKN